MNESIPGAGPQSAPAQPDTGAPEQAQPSGGPGDDPGQAPDEPRVAPLGVPRTATGNDEVDARLERLSDLDHLAADGHIEVYEDVHRGLRDTLTALDTRPGPPAPTTPHGHRS